MLLGAVAVIDDRPQALAFGRTQMNGDASTHPADSQAAKAMGIPTRTALDRIIERPEAGERFHKSRGVWNVRAG
jgi:hypothetical protein